MPWLRTVIGNNCDVAFGILKKLGDFAQCGGGLDVDFGIAKASLIPLDGGDHFGLIFNRTGCGE